MAFGINGDFARGLVNQRNVSDQLDLGRGDLALRQQVFKSQQAGQDAERLKRVEDSVKEQAGGLNQAIQQLKDNGNSTADILKVVSPAIRMLQAQISATKDFDPLLAERLKVDVKTALSGLGPAESAELAGITNSTQMVAELKATLGREPTKEELARAAKVAGPTDPTIVRLQNAKVNALSQGNTEAAAEIQAQIESLGASESFDPRARLSTSKKEDEETRGSIKSAASAGQTIQDVLDAFIETPEAGGIRGSIAEGVGGIAQQLGLGGVAETLLGAPVEEITAVRSQARQAVSQLLSRVTGEESGRFTDKERQIAEEILATLDVTASPEIIQSALRGFQEINDASMMREISSLASRSELDLRQTADLQKLMKTLRDQGLTEEDAIDMIARLLSSEGIDSVE